jgi:uncharacterized protein (TIGR03663 family)
MHNDEGVNAVKFGQLWENGSYKYDPKEFHGPSLYYATAALGRLTGAPDYLHFSERRLRLLTVLFGIGLVLLLPLLADGLGRAGTIWAGVFIALSPALVFYSRYYIHEMLLVFFAQLALAGCWRYWQSRRLRWALLAGAGFGMMDCTKETFVFSLPAAGAALFLNWSWGRWMDATREPRRQNRVLYGHVAGALALWLAISIVLFSSIFTNASGPLDSLRTYEPWFSRAAGDSPHVHSWNFYLHRLLFFHRTAGPVWTEGLIAILAAVGLFAGFFRRQQAGADPVLTRFLALYAILLGAIYSLLPYKTPWCLLEFWHPTILLAGIGAAHLIRKCEQKWMRLIVAGLICIGTFHLGWQAWRQDRAWHPSEDSATQPSDRALQDGLPYAYSQTLPNILDLVGKIELLAAVHPAHNKMPVEIVSSDGDIWPLPWYLRQFQNLGETKILPAHATAPVIIVSAELNAHLDDDKTYLMNGLFELRPRVFFELYIEVSLWRDFLEQRPAQPKE